MASETNMVDLVVCLDKGNFRLDELAQLTGDLQRKLESMDVESVECVREQASQQGAKGTVDPITVGALTVVVVQAVLPKILDFLQAWSLRNQGQVVKVKIQRGSELIEVEFSETTDPKKIKGFIETLTNSMEKKKKRR